MERVDTRSGNATFSEGLNNSYRWYVYTKTSVLFLFGYSLSYTSFEYSNSNLSAASSVQQHSTGGLAIVLVGFVYVVLESGAITTVSIGIREKHLSFYNLNTTSW
ncbi:hypothetical protein PR003_g12480 [Phytophthora rubi]|uniref:beta-glucosidase n=1 Tax=Phytophthora rubi TaxID=129364 RepID=A0A6A4FK75_9STRA|nr:hypothetical protein PR003_g12480 [Phytophthora rubi]